MSSLIKTGTNAVKSVMGSMTGMLGGGGGSDYTPAQAKMDEAHELKVSALNALRAVGVPEIEAQQILLEAPELILPTEQERLGETALANIVEDPALRSQVMEALGELQTRGEEGLTSEDRARFEALREVGAADEQARQARILQSMAERGALDSGAQLAAQLASSQAQTQRAAQQGREVAAEASRARRDALSKAANVASQLSQRDVARQTQQALAQDQIARFNAAVSARETAARQAQADQIAALRNQQELVNKGLIQQKFQNELQKAGGTANQFNAISAGSAAAAPMLAAADQKKKAAMGNMLGTIGTIGGGIVGGIYGGPGGAAIGSTAGGALGRGVGGMMGADGGVKGSEYQDGGVGYNRVDPSQYLAKLVAQQNQIDKAQEFQRGQANSVLSQLRSYDQPIVMQPEKSSGDPLSGLLGLVGNLAGGDGGGGLGDMLGGLMGGAANGGYKKMGYEEGGIQTEGRIIPEQEELTIEDNYDGDNIPDRINAGESVNNLDMQQTNLELLRELQGLRADKAVAQGLATVNEAPQQEIIDVLRGDTPLEEADLSEDIVEPTEAGQVVLDRLLQR